MAAAERAPAFPRNDTALISTEAAISQASARMTILSMLRYVLAGFYRLVDLPAQRIEFLFQIFDFLLQASHVTGLSRILRLGTAIYSEYCDADEPSQDEPHDQSPCRWQPPKCFVHIPQVKRAASDTPGRRNFSAIWIFERLAPKNPPRAIYSICAIPALVMMS